MSAAAQLYVVSYQAARIPLMGWSWAVGFVIVLAVIVAVVVLRVKGVGGRSPGERRDPPR